MAFNERVRMKGAALSAARKACPGVNLTDAAFSAYVEQKVGQAARRPNRPPLHWADLYLACGCARGDRAALELFTRRFIRQIRAAARRVGPEGDFVEDVVQLVLQKVLLGSNDTDPRILDYEGKGPLESWIRAVTLRSALNHRRDGGRRERGPELALSSLVDGSPNPEIQFLQRSCREDFGEAFQSALSQLPPDERRLLRSHAVDALSLDHIAALHGIHRTTVARRIAKIGQTLLKETRRQLSARLKVSAASLDSIIGTVRSNLDITLDRYLRQADADAASRE